MLFKGLVRNPVDPEYSSYVPLYGVGDLDARFPSIFFNGTWAPIDREDDNRRPMDPPTLCRLHNL